MSKLRDFLYKAGDVLLDSVGSAANETLQNKISEKSADIDEKRQQKKHKKSNNKIINRRIK